MRLKDKWKRDVENMGIALSIKQLALIISARREEWRKYYQKIYRDIERGKLDYTQLGEEGSKILLSNEDVIRYLEAFIDSNEES